MERFACSIPTKLYFGVGVIEQLGEIASTYGKKALIVMGGQSSKRTGLFDKVITLLQSKGLEYVVFDRVTPNPLASTVQEGVELVKKEGCDFIIGLGGGSPMDAAKAISFCCVSPGVVTDYFPGEKYAATGPTGSLPLIAITTTAGTGSEVNKVSVITDADTKRKVGIKSTYLYPAAAIVDPQVMVTLPPEVTAATGADAFFHAMESYLSRNANRFTEMFSLEAMKLVVENLERAVREGSDLEARSNMAWANTLAGVSLDHAGAIAIHGTSHPVGAHYDAVHGQILSATAPTYLKHHYTDALTKTAKIAEILGCLEGSEEEKAAKAGECLAAFLKKVGLNIKLRDLRVSEDMLDTLAKDVLKVMGGALANTPGTLGYEDIYRIYRESM